MEVRVRHGKDKQSIALARFHHVVCDQPFEEGGGDAGMTPPELMLSSLGCCAMYYAAEYLKARGLSPDGMELCVTAEKGGSPVRLIKIAVHVEANGLPPRFRTGLLKAVEACLLGRTLAEPPQVSFRMASPVADGNTLGKASRNNPAAP
jgi:putative redox protein